MADFESNEPKWPKWIGVESEPRQPSFNCRPHYPHLSEQSAAPQRPSAIQLLPETGVLIKVDGTWEPWALERSDSNQLELQSRRSGITAVNDARNCKPIIPIAIPFAIPFAIPWLVYLPSVIENIESFPINTWTIRWNKKTKQKREIVSISLRADCCCTAVSISRNNAIIGVI